MSGAQGRTVAAVTLSVDRPGSGSLRLWQIAPAALAGNLALHQLPALPRPLLVLFLTLAALAVLAIAGTRPCRWLGLAAVALLAFCYTAAAARDRLETRWPVNRDGQDVMVRGWIDAVPQRDQGRVNFSLRVIDADADAAPRRLRLSWYDPAPALAAGQIVRVQVRLRAPRGLVNPAGFDYERWLFLEGYDATGYVRNGATPAEPESARDGAADNEAGHGYSFDGGLARRWLQLRARLVERLNASIAPPDGAALIVALSLGERNGFDERDWRILQRTGTSHLVAVSGLHIGLIAALVYWLTLQCALRLPAPLARRAHDCAATLALVAATGYAGLAGFGLPTQRALVMLVVACALAVGRRRWSIGNGLALAVLGVLAHDPMASLTASFWLSFGAVALLLAITAGTARSVPVTAQPVAPDAVHRLYERAIRFCRLQWLLTLGLGPLVLAFYGQISLSSLIVNLVAIPLFSLLLVPLSLLCALCALFDSQGFGLVSVAGHAATLAWQGLEVIAASPAAAIELPRPPWYEIAAGLFAIATIAPALPLPSRRLVWLALLPLVFSPAAKALRPGDARVTVLDVGHGLAVVVATRAHRLLFDAGPLTRSGFDAGAEIVAPVLASLGDAPLDLLVLSHGDSDHAGGAAAVVAQYPAVRILAGPDVEASGADPCEAGQAWTWDQVRFEILHPPAGYALRGNDSSCVLRVEAGVGAVLLSGDIERRAEAVLVSAAAIAADVVVVPHHGSATSSTAAFVNAVGPAVAIVSAAYRNRWNFPRPEVRRRWLDAGARVFVTGEQGAIDVDLAKSGIVVHAARDRGRRYWHATSASVSGAVSASAL